MRYPNEDKAVGISSTPEQKQAAICEALELSSLDEPHPNSAELLRRKVFPLDDESLTLLLALIVDAKTRYAARVAS